ncbi:MAG: TetR family transcriptional regulator [Deltaproteobacteria bacterium]|nr:TetR/AcrR family transcriptional regulator [Deltaproteobacteria bacterium]MBW2223582.1 TetR/AcrR family transcriptional regulator [Deltaproteobacteria bacterium]MBW2548369.1 TetR/AcrR family transcriptional regulator [Deltaproteobacteria bacterium]RLB46946.1 MAG: TetR family transcriptional regulator [Deltaproteobacteria bacterium]
MAVHSPAPRRKRAPDKRARILKAAIKVFAKNGFYATRVSEIAKAAGVADGTIYLYFKNKDDVLVTIFEEGIERLLTILREVAESEEPFENRIQRIIELQLGLMEEQRDLAEVITVNLRQSSRLLKQYATPLFMQYIDVIADVVRDGQEEGTFRKDLNPRVVARCLFGAIDAILLTWALGEGDPAALRKAATHCASLFLEGLRKR